MLQKRYLNFGTPGDAKSIKAMHSRMFGHGVLSGAEMSVGGTNYLNVAPYNILFDSGIIVSEDVIQHVTITTGSSAQNYTISLVHEDVELVGGSAATLQVEVGIKQAVSNGVILGWVVYPGGGIALAASMVWNNRARQQVVETEQRQTIYPPYHDEHVSGLLVSKGTASVTHVLAGSLGIITSKYTASGSDADVLISAEFLLTTKPPRVFEIVGNKHSTPCVLQAFSVFDHSGSFISGVDIDTIDTTSPVLRIHRLRLRDYSDLYSAYGLPVSILANVRVYDGTDWEVYGVSATNLEVPLV